MPPLTVGTLPSQIPRWLQSEVEEYRLPFVKPPTSIADIGANIGAFSIMAKQTWPKARITAFEPFKANCTSLRKNVRGRGIKAVNAAVRNFDGSDWIRVGDMGVTCGFHQLGRQTEKREQVKCVDADGIGRFEFVKIDTEGCELEILSALDLSRTKAIALEYHRAKDIDPLKNIAIANGFKLWREQPHQPNVGTLVFARPGVLAETPTRRHADKRTPKVFVALPAYGSVPVPFMQCLIKLVLEPPCQITVRVVPGDSLVSRARNTLTADFLATDCTHLLFIDTDLIFSSEHISRLLSHNEPIVAGFYPKKQDGDLAWVCNAHLDFPPPDERGLQSLRYTGTGFLMVRRIVFEDMISAHPAIGYKADHSQRVEHDFWPVGVRDRRYLSEDWYFCQRALDLGYKVYGDTKVILKHIGTAIYPMAHQEHAISSS